MIKTIAQNTTAEIVVKKSKFIANIFYVENEQTAQDYIKQINKKYHDAKHNCYAYNIQEINKDDVVQIQKSSDNGEPSGTAGAPLLDLLKKQGLSNVLVVVTRYFGGILLGTGGLVKAYTESAVKALEQTEVIYKEIENFYEIKIDYSELKNIQYNAEKIGYFIKNIEYEENVKVTIETTKEKFEKLMQTEVKILKKTTVKQRIWGVCN